MRYCSTQTPEWHVRERQSMKDRVGLQSEYRAISGALSTTYHNQTYGAAPAFGDAAIRLKREVLSRSCFVVGDAMNPSGYVEGGVSLDDIESIKCTTSMTQEECNAYLRVQDYYRGNEARLIRDIAAAVKENGILCEVKYNKLES